jgi:ribonuclease VapC
VVLDTSALLALFFNEDHAPWVLDQLQDQAASLQMSTVNYAELLILVEDRQPRLSASIREAIQTSSIRLVAPDARQAEIAAAARLRYPFNLGDCFAYALAKEGDQPILTLDRDFRRADVTVILPPRR